MPKTIRIPKTLGGCSDRMFKIREEKKALRAKVDVLDAEYQAIKAKLIETLPKSDAEGVVGRVANARVVTKDVPQVKDWEAFYKHVKRTNNFALLQRRLSAPAVKERWEDGKSVPGVEPFRVVDVSITKKK